MSSIDSQPTAGTLRVAIIGYGLAGAVFHAPLINSTPSMSVAAIVTGNPERQQRAQRDFPAAAIIYSADQLWQDPSRYDLVVVATPNRSHVPLGLSALILTIRQLLDADLDLLGPVTRFESRYERYRETPRHGAWRELPSEEEAGGLLFDLGSHLIDQALLLFGQPTQVYAEVEKRRPGALVDDDTFVALRFASGVHSHLWMSVVARIPGPRMRISGLRGTYEKWGVDPQEDALRTGMRPGDPDWGLEPREKWGRLSTDIGGIHIDGPVEMLPGAYEQFYALLRDALITGGPPPVDPTSAVATIRVIEAAQQSAGNGTVVQL